MVKGDNMKVIEKRKNGSIRVYTVNNEPSMTDQQFKDDCDVNFIVNKFTKTGHLTHLAKFQGMYADVSAIPDLAEAMQIVSTAQTAFDTLPAELRSRFGNSPVNMVEFVNDVNNKDEAIKLGLIPQPQKEQKQDIKTDDNKT